MKKFYFSFNVVFKNFTPHKGNADKKVNYNFNLFIIMHSHQAKKFLTCNLSITTHPLAKIRIKKYIGIFHHLGTIQILVN